MSSLHTERQHQLELSHLNISGIIVFLNLLTNSWTVLTWNCLRNLSNKICPLSNAASWLLFSAHGGSFQIWAQWGFGAEWWRSLFLTPGIASMSERRSCVASWGNHIHLLPRVGRGQLSFWMHVDLTPTPHTIKTYLSALVDSIIQSPGKSQGSGMHYVNGYFY